MAPQTSRIGDLTLSVERPAAQSHKPPVLLIHGMCGGAWYWEPYQGFLAARGYTSHAINLRGHHGSRPVADIGRVPIADFVADTMEVARALKNPIVIGHSMGGLIAQKVAEAGLCRACVLLASAPPRWIPVVSFKLLARQLKHLPSLLRLKPVLADRGDADVLMFNRTPVAERAAFMARLVPESGRAGLEISLGAIGVNESRVTAPVLVVTGRDDQFVVPRVARAIAAKYRAPLKAYDSFAHHIMSEPGWEKPAADIVTWMDQH